ncbi:MULTISPECIES: hypothetical protein [Chryseobacterium]|uniref:hypothetical protein n=1 Tax=Chryseobacterium TaxID=59732 RepID=UPI001296383A|nr:MULTISPECIES: hypothetical protein [Chryseobacterium]MDR6921001.1 hypothetical protein [Chryseobacterium sp. 2987]
MKAITRILSGILIITVILFLGGYFYFNQKFTPEKNYLTVKNESGKIPMKWQEKDKSALLVPVSFSGDTAIYYLQFDTGAVYTEFYHLPIKQIKGIMVHDNHASSTFYIGKTKISSDKFKISEMGKESGKIIGTLGADILEDRKSIINFKENFIIFNLSEEPAEFQNSLIDFTFKKRKIIIRGILRGKEEKFLYDSGTSAYELLTNKEQWTDLKSPQSKIIIEKAQSRPNILTSYTAKSNNAIRFKNKEIPLTEVTYVEGFSQTQYMLMKFSGMTGMLGNKIFLQNCIYIDCYHKKFGIH